MIYFLSDLHGDFFRALSEYTRIATDDDLLIILGDIGLNFESTEENREFTRRLLAIDKPVALVDGNHENFEYLNSFPEQEWHGGKIRRLTEHIVLLMRGNIFDICGSAFFVFGGCKSSPRWKEMGLWYPGDEPTDEELSLAYENLKKCGYRVDYILTHKYEQTPPRGTVCEPLRELTSFIEENVEYKKWYSGHWHENSHPDDKHILVYDKLTSLDE